MKTRQIISIFGIAVLLSCCSTNNTHTLSDHQEDSHSELSESINLYSTYDLSKEDPGCEIYGFSDIESFGRWSNADTLMVELKVLPKSEITVRLDVDSVICQKGEPLEMNILVNGEMLSHISIKAKNKVYVNVPKRNIGADGSLRMIIVLDNEGQSGRYDSENIDDRKMGFALSGITLFGYSMK